MASSCALRVLLICSGLVLALSTCPTGWVEHDGECFMFSTTHAMGWHQAENVCRQVHSYLVTDDNKEKHDFLKLYLNIYHAWHLTHFWVGGSDFVIENQFRWVETGGSLGSTTFWEQGQPNGNTSESCMAFYLNADNDLVWKDDRCTHKYYFICEQKATELTGGVIG